MTKQIGVSSYTSLGTFAEGHLAITSAQGAILNAMTAKGEPTLCTALDINEYGPQGDLLLILFKDQSAVLCTRNTTFLMSDLSFQKAYDLKYDDELYTDSGILKVKSFAFYYKPAKVYTVGVCNKCATAIQLSNGIYANIGQ